MGAAAVEVERGAAAAGAATTMPGKRMGAGAAAAGDAPGLQRGAWLPSAGPAPRRVNFRPALNHAMASTTPASSQQPHSSPSLLRPLNSVVMAGKGVQHRAGPSSPSPAHEPLSWTPASRVGAGFCAMCALQEHVRQALAASGGAVSPSNLVKNLRCISKSFRMWRQEDAHEYLRCLIEGLHNCCLPPGVKSNSSVSQERSLIHKIFGGRLRSQVKCTVCSTCSNTYDPLLDLSLEIVRADSLTKALNRFTAVEALEGDNKYHCSHCRKKVRALKQFTIDKSPNILTIQFKRFSGTGSSGGKIDKKIEFGRTLDMKPYISNPQAADAKYSLYAVLVHAGWSTHSGHYYCFVRTKGDMWHALDDSRVKQVSEKSVLDQKAYILFYIKNSVTQSSAGAEQLLRNSLPAFKKLLSDGAAENADDSSSADDLDNNGRQVSNAQTSQSAVTNTAKSINSLPVRPAGNSQSALGNNTVDTLGGASNLTQEPDTPAHNANGIVSEDVSNGGVLSLVNGTNAENGVKPGVKKVLEVEVSATDTTSMRSDLSSESPAVSTAATLKGEKKLDSNVEANCSTSGEDDKDNDDDDTGWDEYHNHFRNTPQSYMRLLYFMPHTRWYFLAKSLRRQRDRKRSASRKGQCQLDHEGTTSGQCGKTSKRGRCVEESNSGLPKKAKLGNGEGVNADVSVAELITVLRGRLQSNGTCQAGEAVVGITKVGTEKQDFCMVDSVAQTENGSAGNGSSFAAVNGSADVLNQPETRIGEKDVDLDRDSRAAASVIAPTKCSFRLQANGLYDFEVPRWGEVEANGNGHVKDVDRLLRTHKSTVPQRDSWDEEYDRGKLKKVRNKEKQAGYEVTPFPAMTNNDFRLSHNIDD